MALRDDEFRSLDVSPNKSLNMRSYGRKIENHLPITITTTDYLNSFTSLSDVQARIVTLQVKLSSLKLDNHAKDKFLFFLYWLYVLFSVLCSRGCCLMWHVVEAYAVERSFYIKFNWPFLGADVTEGASYFVKLSS
ncbi:hypothetical protein DAPPUDRAFT_313648 [Daphnia pulex]|uniref:Uncharacterized protein n=1 Tax=Daphnia pulex TaxID=6669 RepID=E9G3Q6_DAPPU|nr:hypothetical protein DAPPUDRAFT_313648 [Daphnia pulex]|eukprot:EFX85938.1 hypothetical protein DAPPUDRAFT_313648 [Daphnia pulex]